MGLIRVLLTGFLLLLSSLDPLTEPLIFGIASGYGRMSARIDIANGHPKLYLRTLGAPWNDDLERVILERHGLTVVWLGDAIGMEGPYIEAYDEVVLGETSGTDGRQVVFQMFLEVRSLWFDQTDR